MIQAKPNLIAFDEFIAWYPENSEHRYELHRGVIVEMPKPRGKHSEIAGFLAYQLNIAIRDRNLNYFVPRECLIKPRRDESGYEPEEFSIRGTFTNENRQVYISAWEPGAYVYKGKNLRDGNSVQVIDFDIIGTTRRPQYRFGDRGLT